MVGPEFGKFYTITSQVRHAEQLSLATEGGKPKEVQLSFGIKKEGDPIENLFSRGIKIVREYANLDGTTTFTKGFGGSDIFFITHTVPLKVGDEEITFIVEATSWQQSHDTPKSLLPLSGPISIYAKKKGDPYFDRLHPLFRINGQLSSPSREDNDPQAIRAASELLDTIEESLSNNYPPLSKQYHPKPEHRPKGIRKAVLALSRRFNIWDLQR